MWRCNHAGFDTTKYGYFTFSALPTQAGYKYLVQFYNTSGVAVGNAIDPSVYTHHDHGIGGAYWTVYSIPLTAFGVLGTVGGVSIKDNSGAASNLFYLSAMGFWGNPNIAQPIIWNPGVHVGVYQFGGFGNNGIQVWKDEALRIANANASKLVKGFEVHGNLAMFFPTSQPAGGAAGDWSGAQAIPLLLQMFQYIATLPNGPYSLSVSQNMVGNAFNNLTDAGARSMTPAWWYNNTAFGPVGGDGHGGVCWNTTQGLTHLFWNSACLDEVRACWGAIWTAIKAAGFHIYRFDPCMEMSRAPIMITAGMTEGALLSSWGGTGFAQGMRKVMVDSLLNCKPTFTPSLGANMTAFLGNLHANQWSPGNYDHTNETTPTDSPTTGTLPNGEAAPIKSRAYWGDLGQRGIRAVGGPVLDTNWKALGYDFHAHSSNDTLRNRPTYTAPTPNSNLGGGRLPDMLTHLSEVGASHYYIVSQRDGGGGPPCNSLGGSGGPANYQYPYTGAVVPYNNFIDYLNALNVNSYLNLNRPSAWP